MSALTRATALIALSPEERDRRRQLRTVIIAWVFGAFWVWTISGAAVTRFARQMDTPDWAFGLITAMPFAANLFQIPAILMQTRLGVSRKRIFLITVGLGRLLWVVSAAVPWLLPNHPHLWWQLSITGMLLAWGCNAAGVPAWMDWMADTVPRRLRGRFFGFRQRVGLGVGVVTTLSVGYVLDWVDHAAAATAPPHDLAHPMLRISAAMIALAGVIGFIDTLCFRWIADDHPAPPPRQANVLAILAEPLRDANFRRLMLFNFLLYLAMGFIAQYIILYAFDILRFSNLRVQVMMTAIPLIVHGTCYPIWGRLIDRIGRKPVLMLAGLGMVNGAWGWTLIGHGNLTLSVIGYGITILGMIGWPGVEIASFNMLMGMTGSQGGQRNGGAYLALNAAAVALGGILSGLIGAAAARLLHGFHWTIPLIGVGLTYHGLLLLLSTSIRIMAMTAAAGLHEPRATATRDAIRYVSDDFYATFREAIVLPTRLVGGVARWSYRLPRRVMRR